LFRAAPQPQVISMVENSVHSLLRRNFHANLSSS
jgi:hypothetical protein